MKIKFTALLIVACFALEGCSATQSISELTSSPSYYKTVTSDYGYQDALKIIKDEYARIQGYDLSCTVYTNTQRGECTGTNMHGIFIFISTEHLTETSSSVNFYTAVNNTMWCKKIDLISSKLIR